LSQEVLQIPDMADEPLVEHLMQLYRTEHYADLAPNGVFHQRTQLTAEQRIANCVNQLEAETKRTWNEKAHDYFSRLHHMRIDDAAFCGRYERERRRSTFVLLGLLPALWLLVWHLPVLLLVQWLSGTKIKTVEFAGPVRWAGTLFLYLLYVLLWLGVALFDGNWWWVLVAVLGLVSVPWLIQYFETAQRWLLAWRVRRQPVHLLNYLKASRRELITLVAASWSSDQQA
jgi:hypothetical protein